MSRTVLGKISAPGQQNIGLLEAKCANDAICCPGDREENEACKEPKACPGVVVPVTKLHQL